MYTYNYTYTYTYNYTNASIYTYTLRNNYRFQDIEFTPCKISNISQYTLAVFCKMKFKLSNGR